MTHTIADSQGCPIPSPHITLSCTHRWVHTHLDRDTNEHSCPGAIRLANPAMEFHSWSKCFVQDSLQAPAESLMLILYLGSQCYSFIGEEAYEGSGRLNYLSRKTETPPRARAQLVVKGCCPTPSPSSPPEELEVGSEERGTKTRRGEP